MNTKFIKHLSDIAYFFTLKKDQWRANAHIKAMKTIEAYSKELQFNDGKLIDKLAGIGVSIQKTLEEVHLTGTSSKYKEFCDEGLPPPEIQELQRIPQVGAQTARKMWEKFKIVTLLDFESKIEEIEKSEFAKYVLSYREIKGSLERLPRHVVKEAIDFLLKDLVGKIVFTYAGSMRRGKEMLRDVDVIVCLQNPEEDKKILKEHFTKWGLSCDVRDGDAKWGISVPVADQFVTLDLNFCLPNEFGAYKNYLTGSKEHNIALRGMAKEKGYLVNQKGIFKDDCQVDDGTEEFLFSLLDIPYIPPPCRELGAVGKDFTNLVQQSDIVGDFHIHTTESDGFFSIEEMVAQAVKEGLSIIGISDHSPGSGGGQKELEKLQSLECFHQMKFPISVYYGAEIDVKANGELDYSDDLIERLQYYIIAAHHSQNNLTERYIKAMERFPSKGKIIAHPLNRKLGTKLPGEIDWNKIFECCKENNTVLEVNCQPERLDLDDKIIKMASNAGVYIMIGSDTHGSSFTSLHENGILMCQRGWLMKDICLNTNLKLIERWLNGRLYK